MAQEKIVEIDKGSMKRTLGVGDLVAVGYGDLGSSIYYALGIVALYALGATPIALMLAGFVFACTALTYAEMSSIPKMEGGSTSYSRHAFNDLVSFIAGWGLLLDFIVTIAISSYAVGPYLAFFFEVLQNVDAKISFTIVIIFALFVINLFGAKHSTRISWVLTSLTVITQLVIIVIGAIWLLNVPELFRDMRIGDITVKWSPSWKEFWKGTAMAMVAYTGIESMAQLGSEAKKPARTVPHAIIYAMGLLLLIYMGIASVALSALTPTELSTKYLENPVAGIVSALPFAGPILQGWVAILAAIILFVAANAGLMGASRLSFQMGENYQIPRFIYKLHPRYKTPYLSLAIFGGIAGALVLLSGGKLTFLADLYTFGAMLAFFAAHLSLIMLRIRKPTLKRPFKIPLNLRFRGYEFPLTALVGALATFGTWILVIITKPQGRYLGFTWLTIGLAMYLYYRRRSRLSPRGKLEIEKIKIPDYKPLSYKHILVPTRGGAETQTVQMACQIARLHGAQVTAVNVIAVPFSLSLDAPLYYRTVVAEAALKRAEAIGRENHVPMHLKITNARSVDRAILELLETGEYDLLVLGASISPGHLTQKTGLGSVTDRILKDAPCPVVIACTKA